MLASPARGFPARHRHSPLAHARTPFSLREWFLAQDTSRVPEVGQGTCSGTGWSPRHARAQAVTTSPPRRRAWLPAAGLLPAGPAPRGPRPLARHPAPLVSRETLDFQRQLCRKSGFTVGCHAVPGGCWAGTRPWFRPSLLGGFWSVPGSVFGEAVAFMGKQREEQVVSGLHRPTRCRTPRYDVRLPAPTPGTPPRDTGVQERANPSLAAQDPPRLPPAPRLRSA